MRFQLDPRGPSLYRPVAPPSPAPSGGAAETPRGAGGPAKAPAAEPARSPSSMAAVARPAYATAGASGGSAYGSVSSGAPFAPTLPRPRPAAAPPRQARSRTKLYAFAAVALVLLVGSGLAGAYWMELPPFEYPRRYMLTASEMPNNMELADIEFAGEEFGLTENPGRIGEDRFASFGHGPLPDPKEGWAQVLSPVSAEAPLVVAALRFTDEDDARSWASLVSSQCGNRGGALLRDGEVVVVVVADSLTAQGYMGRVMQKLQDEAPGLEDVCDR